MSVGLADPLLTAFIEQGANISIEVAPYLWSDLVARRTALGLSANDLSALLRIEPGKYRSRESGAREVGPYPPSVDDDASALERDTFPLSRRNPSAVVGKENDDALFRRREGRHSAGFAAFAVAAKARTKTKNILRIYVMKLHISSLSERPTQVAQDAFLGQGT